MHASSARHNAAQASELASVVSPQADWRSAQVAFSILVPIVHVGGGGGGGGDEGGGGDGKTQVTV